MLFKLIRIENVFINTFTSYVLLSSNQINLLFQCLIKKGRRLVPKKIDLISIVFNSNEIPTDITVQTQTAIEVLKRMQYLYC